MTVLESTAIAVLGSLAGIVLYLIAMPLVGLVPFGGQPIGAGELWVGPGLLLFVVLAVAALAAISAAVGLRQVSISPLGVRTRQTAPRMHWMRFVIGAAAVLLAYALLGAMSGIADIALSIAVLGTGFGIGIGVLNLIGPWALGIAARISLRRANTATKLLAARGILESPKAAWRQVSALSMVCFTAVVAGAGAALLQTAQAEGPEDFLLQDVMTGVFITVIAGFLMVACSAGINQAATVLDRAELYRSLHRMGMPREVIDAARTGAVMQPVVLVSAASAAVSAVLLFPVTGAAILFNPVAMAFLAGCVVVGILLVRAGLAATSPVLTSVLEREA